MSGEWRDLIQLGEITALSLDTSIIRANSYNFESGLLSLMTKSVRATVLISEVVEREIKRHLVARAVESIRNLDACIRDADRQHVLGTDAVARFADTLKTALQEPVDWANQRLDDWIKAIGAEVVSCKDYVDVAELMDRYFDSRAPFSDKGDKKHEFPDALALLSMEAWAEKNDTGLLLVSKDSDWRRYCETSARLHCIDDLADAINGFNGPTAANACKALIESVRSGDPLGLVDRIKVDFDREVTNKWNVDLEVSSQQFIIENYGFEAFAAEDVNFDGHEALDPRNFEPLNMEEGVATVQVTTTAYVTAVAWVSLGRMDPIDRDYLDMGSTQVVLTEPVTFDVLVRVGGSIPDAIEIEDVEILPMSVVFDAGEIEPE